MHPKNYRRVWIELDKPSKEHDAEANCAAGNAVLDKLYGDENPFRFFPGSKTSYNLRTHPIGTYLSLTDRGHWFMVTDEDVAEWTRPAAPESDD